jgi:glycogen operon protein
MIESLPIDPAEPAPFVHGKLCLARQPSALVGGVAKHADVHRFVALLNSRRLLCEVEDERRRGSLNTLLREANKAWHGVRLLQPDWNDWSHSLALGAELRREGLFFHLMLNAYWEPLDFELPSPGHSGPWKRWIDTALDSPDDIVPWEAAPLVPGGFYRAEARAVVILISVKPTGASP